MILYGTYYFSAKFKKFIFRKTIFCTDLTTYTADLLTEFSKKKKNLIVLELFF